MLNLIRPSRPARALLLVLACSAGPVRAQDVAKSLASPPAPHESTSTPSESLAGVAQTPFTAKSASAARVESPRPSVWHDLFGATWGDIRRLPSRQTVGWMGIGAVAAASVRPADSKVGRSLSTAQLNEPFEAGATIGSTPVQLGISAAAYALGRASHSARTAAVGADLFRAQLISQGLTIAVKESVRRRRPEGSGFAFPSGHTTVSFASATVVQQHLGWRIGMPAYAIATYVALSRVQMKRHYLSDVAFGAAMGVAIGRTVTIGHERRMQVAPMAVDGGAGVQFTWLGQGR